VNLTRALGKMLYSTQDRTAGKGLTQATSRAGLLRLSLLLQKTVSCKRAVVGKRILKSAREKAKKGGGHASGLYGKKLKKVRKRPSKTKDETDTIRFPRSVRRRAPKQKKEDSF